MNHYVYRITNKIFKKHYYGVRSCGILPKDDIGIVYFSSSTNEIFMTRQREHPEEFKYKISKLFETRIMAENYETMLHTKFNVSMNNNFYSDNLTQSQKRHNTIIQRTYELLSKLDTDNITNNPDFIQLKSDIETNIFSRNSNIIHLSYYKISQHKNFVKYFSKIDNFYIINEKLKTISNDLSREIFNNKINKKHLKTIFVYIKDDILIVNKNVNNIRNFKKAVYFYIGYLFSDIELYNCNLKYGKKETELINELVNFRDITKKSLSDLIPFTSYNYNISKAALNRKSEKYFEIIGERIHSNFKEHSDKLLKVANTSSDKFILEYKNVIDICVIMMVYYKVVGIKIKQYKKSFSSKSIKYEELFV